MPNTVSVILPTYNEAGHIVELVQSVITCIPEPWHYEILVVDDNSPDKTCEIVADAFRSNAAVIPILRSTDRGLAKSIRTGIERATGDTIVVMDSDFTHDPKEIPRLLHVAAIYDIVTGSRFCPGGVMQDTTHYLASLAFNWFVRLVIRTQIQDNLGGFFAINAEKLKRLPHDLIFFGYGDYFFRLLHYAQCEAMSVVELPAKYLARRTGSSKSQFVKMLWSYTVAVFRLKTQAERYERSVEARPRSA